MEVLLIMVNKLIYSGSFSQDHFSLCGFLFFLNLFIIYFPAETPLGQKLFIRASNVSQWVKVLAIKPDSLGSVPGTHIIESKNQFLDVVF